MAKLNLKKSKFSNFISSKGFYVALAICLLGTGATAWFAVDRTLTGVGDKQGGSPSTNFSSGAEVNQNVSDMPQSSASASSAPSASSSSEASKQSSEKSDSSQTQSTAQSTLYVLPITGGKVVNAYSAGELVKSKTLNEWRTHDGIDFEAQVSTPVKAVADEMCIRDRPIDEAEEQQAEDEHIGYDFKLPFCQKALTPLLEQRGQRLPDEFAGILDLIDGIAMGAHLDEEGASGQVLVIKAVGEKDGTGETGEILLHTIL